MGFEHICEKEDIINKMDKKLDNIGDVLANVNENLALMNQILVGVEGVPGTGMLAKIDSLEKKNQEIEKELADLKVFKAQILAVGGAWAAIGGIMGFFVSSFISLFK